MIKDYLKEIKFKNILEKAPRAKKVEHQEDLEMHGHHHIEKVHPILPDEEQRGKKK